LSSNNKALNKQQASNNFPNSTTLFFSNNTKTQDVQPS
jgi:hypothetical protein